MIRQTLWSDVAAPLQNAFQTNNSGNRPVLMMLGGYTFSLASLVYQELARVNEYRWAAIERYGQRDARQYTGPGDESIELPGIAYPDWQGQRASLTNYAPWPPKANPYSSLIAMASSTAGTSSNGLKNAKATITPTAHHGALNSHSPYNASTMTTP